jgi:hypothetical protein
MRLTSHNNAERMSENVLASVFSCCPFALPESAGKLRQLFFNARLFYEKLQVKMPHHTSFRIFQ